MRKSTLQNEGLSAALTWLSWHVTREAWRDKPLQHIQRAVRTYASPWQSLTGSRPWSRLTIRRGLIVCNYMKMQQQWQGRIWSWNISLEGKESEQARAPPTGSLLDGKHIVPAYLWKYLSYEVIRLLSRVLVQGCFQLALLDPWLPETTCVCSLNCAQVSANCLEEFNIQFHPKFTPSIVQVWK